MFKQFHPLEVMFQQALHTFGKCSFPVNAIPFVFQRAVVFLTSLQMAGSQPSKKPG
jgi:hypothetical protein